MANDLLIFDYEPHHHAAFRALNHEWITRYFVLEAPDHQMLDNPQSYILGKGGHIFMGSYGGAVLGTCSLVPTAEAGVYELAKMAVSPRAQGQGLGRALGHAVLAKARTLGAHRVELISDSQLRPALKLYEQLGFRHVPVPAGGTGYQRGDVKMMLDL